MGKKNVIHQRSKFAFIFGKSKEWGVTSEGVCTLGVSDVKIIEEQNLQPVL
jgi:hypothetical protein